MDLTLSDPLSVRRATAERAEAAIATLYGSTSSVTGAAHLVRKGSDDVIIRCYHRESLDHVTSACAISQRSRLFCRELVVGCVNDAVVVERAPWGAVTEWQQVERSAAVDATASFLTAVGEALREIDVPGAMTYHCQTVAAARAGALPRGGSSYEHRCHAFHERIAERTPSHECRPQIVHGDLRAENVAARDGRLRLFDFEYAHHGCWTADLGKWFAQSGLLDRRTSAAALELLRAMGSREAEIAQVLTAALVWCADARWVSTAASRGRPDVVRYAASDLARIERLSASDHWIWPLVARA